MDTGLGRTTGNTVVACLSTLVVARAAARANAQAGELTDRPLTQHRWKAVVAAEGLVPLGVSSSSAPRMCQAPTTRDSHRSSGEER
jgi:hypothetical protein